MRIGSTSNYPLELLKNRSDEESLKIIAREFEALFLKELMHSMRKSVDSINGGETNFMKSTYLDLFEIEVSRALAERGMGIKDLLLRKLKNGAVPIREGHKVFPKANEISDSFQSLVLPVNGILSSQFGLRIHPIYKEVRFHKGIDIATSIGTPIYPVKEGKVILSVYDEKFGNIIAIDHGNGLVTKYAHNAINLVKTGDVVTMNTMIAKVGNTGVTTGPHLHFEIIRNGLHIDPLKFVKKEQI